MMSDNIVWKFGAYADSPVTTTIFDQGERKTQTLTAAELRQVDDNIDPWTILASLGETSDAVRYQIAGEEFTSAKINEMIDDGDLTLTPAGSIILNGETLEYAQVGYEVHVLMIEKLQDDIDKINALLEKLNYISAALNESETFKKNDSITYNWIGALNNTDQFFSLLKEQTPNMSDAERFSLIRTANNDYISWENIEASTVQGNLQTYRYGTHTITTSQFNMQFYENDIANALEALRNTVKEKTTQTETLSTDFQSSNEQYTAVISAMSKYAEDFYGSLNELTE